MNPSVKVLDELIEAIGRGDWPNRQPGQINTVADLVGRWHESGNPHFMDVAQLARISFEAPETPEFRKQVGLSTQARLNGASGTLKQVAREYWKYKTFVVMCNLIFHKARLSEAAEKAAVWADRKSDGFYSPTASTLEKQYSDEWRRGGTEEVYHSVWNRHGKLFEKEWLEALKNMDCLPENSTRRGERR